MMDGTVTHGNAERRGEGGGGIAEHRVVPLRGGAYVSQETPGQICAIIERNKNTTPVDILH